jgi:hypothetical protein
LIKITPDGLEAIVADVVHKMACRYPCQQCGDYSASGCDRFL